MIVIPQAIYAVCNFPNLKDSKLAQQSRCLCVESHITAGKTAKPLTKAQTEYALTTQSDLRFPQTAPQPAQENFEANHADMHLCQDNNCEYQVVMSA